MTKRVYIAEHSNSVRNRIHQAVARIDSFEVVGEANVAHNAVAAIDDLDPDIVITDVLLKDANGIDLVKRVRARHGPERPAIYVLGHRLSATHRSALAAAGANGFFDRSRGYSPLLSEMHGGA